MNIGVILAGGTGSRMGIADRPKQFLDIYQKPVVVHTLEAFELHEGIDVVCVVCLKDWQEDLSIWLKQYDIRKVRHIVDAGETRQQSSYNALTELQKHYTDKDIVVIHDAARPLISQRIISENIEKAMEYGACDTIIPAYDTIVRSLNGETLTDIPVRKVLYVGQTPQSFELGIILKAHERYMSLTDKPEVTDDCALVLHMEKEVGIAWGDSINLKITTFDDLLLAKSLVRAGRS